MRRRLVVAACAVLPISAAPASAATIVTSASTMACVYECRLLGVDVRALQPFDTSLGTLTGVTLAVSAGTSTFYQILFPNNSSPATQSGSAQLAFETTFDLLVNGFNYSFTVSGADAISLTGSGFTFIPRQVFTTSGSGIFELDPSLFASFTVAQSCVDSIFNQYQTGLCVSGMAEDAPTLDAITASSDNLTLQYQEPPPNIEHIANFTLTYTYTPFSEAVPEPATWAMMLFGFGAIGLALRKTSRHSALIEVS